MIQPRTSADHALQISPDMRHGGPLLLNLPGEWVADALCAQVDPEMFFPEKGGSTREALRICRRCPVTVECLDYAMSVEGESSSASSKGTRFGIWGGTSERQRRKLKRLEQRPSGPPAEEVDDDLDETA